MVVFCGFRIYNKLTKTCMKEWEYEEETEAPQCRCPIHIPVS